MRLTVEGVARRFGRRRVFEGLDAVVEHGQALVVAGPNGSGKSTLLVVIAGLLRPTRGRVVATLDGKLLPPEERRQWLGMVAPDLTLYPEREHRVQVALIRDAARSLAQACRDLARELREGAES